MNDIEAILWESIEDYEELYKATWELNTIHPELGLDSATRRAKWVIYSLIRHGFIELYWCHYPGERMWLIKDNEISEALSLGKHWLPATTGENAVLFSATEKGERLYQQLYKMNRNQIPDDDSLIKELTGRI